GRREVKTEGGTTSPTPPPEIDPSARHGVAPTPAKPNEQPGAHPLARHTRQDLSEEHADSGRGNHGDTRHLLIARSERVYDIVPAQARKRDLQHGHQDRERGPTYIKQRDDGPYLIQFDLTRDIPKARASDEQLGRKDCNFFAPTTTRPARHLKVAATLVFHSHFVSDLG